MARIFEKITFDQFKKDICDNKRLYDEYSVPSRSTKYSAGYDFKAIDDIIIRPGEIKKVSTGIKANMNSNEVLYLFVRSSMGFKYNLRLCNQVGVIDKDYYNNVNNEGHIFVKIQNEGTETITIKKNEGYIQGVFMNYLIVDDENEITTIREGGIGSTNKGDESDE